MSAPLALTVLAGELAVVRLAPDAPVPSWMPTSGLTAVTRTDDELSLVCGAAAVDHDPGGPVEGGWRALRLEGPFAFSLTGILVAVLTPLADAGVSIFALSTYDTDYVLVPERQLDAAVAALRSAGHAVAT